jgi:hypothetical protein
MENHISMDAAAKHSKNTRMLANGTNFCIDLSGMHLIICSSYLKLFNSNKLYKLSLFFNNCFGPVAQPGGC